MVRTASIKLGDDKDYIISSFNVGDFIDIEKKFGSLSLDANKLEPVVYWFWLSVKKHHKEMTLNQLYELIDAPFIASGGIIKLFDALNIVNGWDKLPKNEPSPAKV